MKFQYDNQSEIPEALRAYYKQEGDKWVLQCEGATSNAKVAEFRDRNIQLQKDKEELEKKYKDVDPVKYADLVKREAELGDGELIKKSGVDALVQKRTETMRNEYETKLKEANDKLTTAHGELTGLKIDHAVLAEAGPLGLRKTAHADLVSRARTSFKMEDGKPVAYDEKGQKVYGADGQPLTIKEWSTGMVKSAPHLFEPNSGGGSSGGGGGTFSGPNPFVQGQNWNLTEQMRIMRQNPQEAARLQAAAGAAKQ
jgi:hypothetical protein